MCECKSCEVRLQTNYAEFSLCPVCSQRDGRCMICGAPADYREQSMSIQPQQQLPGGGNRSGTKGPVRRDNVYGPAPDSVYEHGSRSSKQADDSLYNIEPEYHHELDLPPPPPSAGVRLNGTAPSQSVPSLSTSSSRPSKQPVLDRNSLQVQKADPQPGQWRPCSPPKMRQPSLWVMNEQHPWLANERPPSPQREVQQYQHPWLPNDRPPSPPRIGQQSVWPVGGAQMDGLPPTWAPRRASQGSL